ncbi:MAG: hypothetical protein AABY22_17740, partial [Nanoarchaeota archaeon]
DYTFSVGFPLGTACEIFNYESLKKVINLTQNPIHHEHLGTYFLDETAKFKVGFLKAPKDWVDKYQNIAEKLLDYDIRNDLIPDLL